MTTSDTVIAAYGRQTVRAFYVSCVAATLCCFVVLLAPALGNRYPLLQYDTGGYLARWYEGYLVPSRSTVFGLFLHLGEGLHFWPELVLQTGCAIWVMSLVLRTAGFAVGAWHRTLMVAGLSLVTALPGRQHPADRHLRRAERAFAPSPDLSSFGFRTLRTNWALFAHRLRRGHA